MGASTARVQAGRYRTLYRHGAFGLVPGTNNCRLAAGLPSEPAKGLMARLLVPSLPIVVVDAADRFDQSHPLELQCLIVDRAECLAGPQVDRICHKCTHLATGFADAAAVVLKISDALAERFRNLFQPYRAHPVDALFVLLHLLERDAEERSQFFLAHFRRQTPGADLITERLI